MLAIVLVLVSSAPQVPVSVAVSDDALAIMGNPAGLGVNQSWDFYCMYNLRRSSVWQNCALCGRLEQLGGFWEPGSRYGLGLGLGNRGLYGGVKLTRDSLTRWGLGALARPVRWLSVGAVWNDLGHNWGSVTAGIALRPFGNRLTLSADALGSAPLRPVVGFETEPLNGVALAGRLKPDDMSFSLGLTIGLGRMSVGTVGSRVGQKQQVGAVLRLGKQKRRSLLPSKKRYVEVKLVGSVADQKPGFSLSGSRPARTTWELLDLVQRARKDRSVCGLVLKLEGFSPGLAQAQELRSALADFRAAGKKVFVYAPHLGMMEFYVASVADRILCYPLGDVSIPGVTATALFLKGTLEKLGIEPDAIRHGKYKSAVETFTEDSLTETNREQIEAMLDAVFDDFVEQTSNGRGIGRDSMERLVNIGFFSTREAAQCGLVDELCYPDELDSILKKQVPGFGKMSESSYRGIEDYEYDWQRPAQVAVVYATGSIETGESRTDFLSGEMTMGANTIVNALRRARKDSRVKAVVLRVDSPGGDGFASDLIWREVELCRKKKPVVVSMGNVAASGGYYISCTADRIFASPGTVTGSIGVFNLKFVTEGLYNKLGARRQVLKRGAHAGAMSDQRPLTPEEESLFTRQIDEFYRQFVEKVASGRRLRYEQVDSVAQGRVWTGRDARRVGLVDSLGGVLPALEWAKTQAKLKDCECVFYPSRKAGLGPLLERLVQALVPRVALWP
ncbi:MAG: signal peptide peptidase SppA [candidate division WOR-3 bacterium]